jgi:hypothetical protein
MVDAMRTPGPMEKFGRRLDDTGRATGQSRPVRTLLLTLIWIVIVVGAVAVTWFLFFLLTLLVIAGLDAAGALRPPAGDTRMVIATTV